MENIGYVFLAIAVIAWFVAILSGVILAFPFGIIGLFTIIGIGFLFAKVIKEKIRNKDDDYYSKNVDL